MNNTELVRELKRRLTMAIWQQALATKSHTVCNMYLAIFERQDVAKQLEELADNWGKK